MRTKYLIKHFVFEEQFRHRITLGENVRLNPKTNVIQLQSDAGGIYPTGDDLYAATWVSTPNSVKQWAGFECRCQHANDDLGEPVTSIGFRLSNGVDQYWHDGAEWITNETNWNTESEVANNIQDFTTTNRSIQVIVNLKTSDQLATPTVSEVKVLYTSNVHHQEDYVYRTLVRQLRNVAPISDHIVELTEASSTVQLTGINAPDGGYNIIDVDAVFNHTTDAGHDTDIMASYEASTKTITLNGEYPSGTVLWIQFVYEPEICVNESSEYKELAKVPAIVISDIQFSKNTLIAANDSVVNKSNHTAVVVLGPRIADIEFTLNIVTRSTRDQNRLADELRGFFDSHPAIDSWGMDESFRLRVDNDYSKLYNSGADGIFSGKFMCTMINAVFFDRVAQNASAVARLKLTGDADVDIE